MRADHDSKLVFRLDGPHVSVELAGNTFVPRRVSVLVTLDLRDPLMNGLLERLRNLELHILVVI